jgi:hypothetical protein
MKPGKTENDIWIWRPSNFFQFYRRKDCFIKSAFDESISETQKKLDKLANIFPYHNPDDYWLFFPSMKIGDQIIPWNSFISDYLISFAIGHILRYEPKLIDEDSKDSFLSKTWCSQAADEVVRQFLFRLSNPSIVL